MTDWPRANSRRLLSVAITGFCWWPRSTKPALINPCCKPCMWLKRLAGVQAVQTLSRLNRIAPGKSRTFVLDFANEEEDIYKAFKPYYETTSMGENADPQRLSELQHHLLERVIFTQGDVTEFAKVWYRGKHQHSASDNKRMNAILDAVVQRFQPRPRRRRA